MKQKGKRNNYWRLSITCDLVLAASNAAKISGFHLGWCDGIENSTGLAIPISVDSSSGASSGTFWWYLILENIYLEFRI